MSEAEMVRFGFVVDEVVAKKLYAVLRHQQGTDVRASMTGTFESMVGAAYESLPKSDQDLSKIVLRQTAKLKRSHGKRGG
jgi:hypothetical protein